MTVSAALRERKDRVVPGSIEVKMLMFFATTMSFWGLYLVSMELSEYYSLIAVVRLFISQEKKKRKDGIGIGIFCKRAPPLEPLPSTVG